MVMGQAKAAIINTIGVDNGNGTVTDIDIPSPDTVTLTKTFGSIGPMLVTVTVNSTGLYNVEESIINSTGIAWTDFHWELVDPTGNVKFEGITGWDRFPSVTHCPIRCSGLMADCYQLAAAFHLDYC